VGGDRHEIVAHFDRLLCFVVKPRIVHSLGGSLGERLGDDQIAALVTSTGFRRDERNCARRPSPCGDGHHHHRTGGQRAQ
jgi:hypothetical protein